MDIGIKILVLVQKIDNLLSQMVDIDCDVIESGLFELEDDMFQHCFPIDGK